MKKPKRMCERVVVEQFVEEVFTGPIHIKRVASLTNGVDGVLHAASLGIRAIGRGMAAANDIAPTHACKQLDRLLSNKGIPIVTLQEHWVRYILAQRREIIVNFDWTDFDDCNHTMLVLGMQTEHGRCTPLVWTTVKKSTLKGKRSQIERDLLMRFASMIPDSTRVTVVADRGFGSVSLYRFLEVAADFDYVIRFKSNVLVEDSDGVCQPAHEWLSPSGRARVLKQAKVTGEKQIIPVVISVKKKGMKQPWHLASSRSDLTATRIMKIYNKRFTIEETFRDFKNHRFGLGMSMVKIKREDRRDRLFMLATLAHSLLTLLGQAARNLSMDRFLGASRVGDISIFKMGLFLFDLVPNMNDERLLPVLKEFGNILLQQSIYRETLGAL